MIEVSIPVVLVAFYLAFKRHEPFDWQVAAATAVMAVYLVIYLAVPPQLGITSPQTGKLFGLLPALSFAVHLGRLECINHPLNGHKGGMLIPAGVWS